mmetsp:Transcript_536/g.849  ORF Transcript_536/g.849 Transcript_536/m.849 type:complete len:322 (-) Transcript_536:300-1265(-)
MSGLGDRLKVHILSQLHVLGVDAHDFHTADLIGDTDIDFSVEATSTTEGRVDGVGSVGGGNDDDLASALGTVHEGKELGDDSLLGLTVTLLSVGSDGVDLIDKDDGGRVLLALIEGLSQVLLGLTGLGGHDLGTVQEEEEGASLVGDSLGNEGLTRAGRAVKKHTLGRLDTERLEKLGVAQGKLDHLTDLGHLLAAATDVVVADLFSLVFVISVDGLALVEERSGGRHDTELARLDVDDLELDGAEGTSDEEGVVLLDGAVAVLEVRDQVRLRDVSSDTLNRVCERKHMDLSRVRNIIWARVHGNDVAHTNTQVAAHNLVH